MSDFVLRTPRPQHADHTVYYRFETQKTENQEQTRKRPLQKQNTDQETETKAKKNKQSAKQNSETKSKTPASREKKPQQQKHKKWLNTPSSRKQMNKHASTVIPTANVSPSFHSARSDCRQSSVAKWSTRPKRREILGIRQNQTRCSMDSWARF